VSIEPELVETVLGEVAAGRIDPGLVGRGAVNDAPDDRTRVETPYLQLVMQKLWEVERERHSTVLRLATLAELGGAQRIVENHLEHAMAALTPLQRDVAAGMFDHLVTPSGAKIAHGVTDLASFARVEPSQIEPVLSSLARERILRPTGENGSAGDRYEIYHDVLAGAVLAWRAKHEAEMALVREREASWRRQRRLAIVAGISLTAFALMAFLAAYAISQRSTARHQTAIALAAQARSERETHRATLAKQREQRGKIRYQHLSSRYQQTARHETQLRLQSEQQQSRLDSQNTQLKTTQGQLQTSITNLQAKTKLANDATKLAKQKTADARQRTADTLLAYKQVNAGALLSRAQAELATDPVQSVRSVLASIKIAPSAGAEDVLRSALLATHVLAELPTGGQATDAAYSFDSSKIAVSSRSGDVRVFAVTGGRLLATLPGGSPLNTLAWTPNGQSVAAGGKSGAAALWDVGSKTVLHTFPHGAPVLSVAISLDGRVLASGGGNDVKLWDVGSRLLLRTIPLAHALRRVSFSNDGQLLLTVSRENAAHVWSVATGDLVSTLPQKTEVTAAAFSPDGTQVATASRDATAKVWNARTGVSTATMVGHSGSLFTIAFSPLGDKVITGSIDGTARVWSVNGGLTDLRTFDSQVVSVAFSPNGQSAVAVDDGGRGLVFGTAAQIPIDLLGQSGRARRALFAPDGLTVATVAGSSVRLWEPYGEVLLQGIHKGAAAATAVAFDPAGKLLASGGADGTVFIQKAESGVPVRTRNVGAPIVALGWASDGTLMMAAKDGTVHLSRDAGSTEALGLTHGSQLVGAALRPDGATVATAGTDGYVRIWNASTRGRILEVQPGTGLNSVALDPTGHLVAAGVANDVVVYDAQTGKPLHVLAGHTDAVTGLSFSPNGKLLASSSRDHDARVWDMKSLTGKILRRHSAFVSGVAFSPDGRWLATAGPAKAGIWAPGQTDLPGSFLQFARNNVTPLTAVAFSSRNWELATAARDGSIRIVDCKLCGGLSQLKAYAKARVAHLPR